MEPRLRTPSLEILGHIKAYHIGPPTQINPIKLPPVTQGALWNHLTFPRLLCSQQYQYSNRWATSCITTYCLFLHERQHVMKHNNKGILLMNHNRRKKKEEKNPDSYCSKCFGERSRGPGLAVLFLHPPLTRSDAAVD